MFQNINESTIDNQNYREEKKENKKTEIFSNVFSIKNKYQKSEYYEMYS